MSLREDDKGAAWAYLGAHEKAVSKVLERMMRVSQMLMLASPVMVAGPGVAASKAENCALIGNLTAELYQLRLDDVAESDALLQMVEKHKNVDTDILRTLPSINPWVYNSLGGDLEPADVGAAMTDQCNAT